jgi:hypothetical protein
VEDVGSQTSQRAHVRCEGRQVALRPDRRENHGRRARTRGCEALDDAALDADHDQVEAGVELGE